VKKLILAIETSCDETGIALVEASGGLQRPRFAVLKNLISSQIKTHRPFGGVVPNLAKREHAKNLPLLFRKILGISKSESLQLAMRRKFTKMNFLGVNQLMKRSFIISKQSRNLKFQISKIDLIAVTVGPGLEPALWAGITFAQDLYKKLKIENPKLNLIGANHLEGHLYSFLLSQKRAISKSESLNSKKNLRKRNLEIRNSRLEFPAVSLLASGGHTILLVMESLVKWKKLGETRDDAVGEAFDKVARMLGLSPYPGGPEIEKLAQRGNPTAILFPRPMLNQKNYDFSFSGLKTSVFYHLRDNAILKTRIHSNNPNTNEVKKNFVSFGRNSGISGRWRADIAASFQQAAIDVLVSKTMRAAREFNARSIILCGGVAANKALRQKLKTESSKLNACFLVPDSEYNTDNAAMIAAAGYFAFLKKKKLPLVANGDLSV